MEKLVRFGISMEQNLLQEFDRLIEEKGYTNRSEAIRDIVRDKLIEENVQDPSAYVFGALVFLYDHHKRELEKSLSNIQHEYYDYIVCTSHVHVDHDHCFEVILLKGTAKQINLLADTILSQKGVIHGKLTITSVLPISHRHIGE
ncbi:MAG TPA: nickel-responsive transcriptional regulator NikR [Bacteroidota bacterium]|nr:nickel-responsive transcriptional regulator NikR [Bacteroidota bacterium]